MSGASWIKMRTDLATHPKVVRIASALRADKLRVVGGLWAVWTVFDQHSVDGVLDGYTPEAMDAAIGWDGFCAQILAIGWLDYDGVEVLRAPRFEEHNGQSAKRRATETQRKRDARTATAIDPPSVPDLSAPNADKKRTRRDKSSSSLRSEEQRSLTAADLEADGVCTEAAAEFVALRKRKRAKLTPLAWAGIRVEASKAGWSIDAVIRKCLARGWQGFEAEWVKGGSRSAGGANDSGETAWQRSQRERVAEMTGGLVSRQAPTGSTPATETIDAHPATARLG